MKNKTMNKLQWASALVTVALFTACQQDMAEDVIVPETSKQMNVIVTAQQGGGVDSRISYTPQAGVDGTSVTVRWEGNESIAYSYYDEDGVHLGVLPAIENSLSDDGKSQQFGGTLNLNNEVNEAWHWLFHPVPWDSWITQNNTEKTLTIRRPMNDQVQDCTPSNETKHLEAYNIMNVLTSQMETGNATVSFEHKTSLLYMDLTLPETNTINSLKLVSEQAMFGTEFKMAFRLNDSGLASGTDDDKMATNMTLTLQNDAEDTSVKGYLMLTPYYIQENQSVTFHVEATATDGATYKSEDITVSTKGYLFKAGQCKTLKRTLTKVVPIMGDKTATQAVKGDYAMADGSFISKGATLTDEQKTNVRGIVFWTTADSNTSGTTPAKLTDDKIMQADFPNCNHGLIVALNNISGSSIWQSNNTNNLVADWQTNTFNVPNKSDYSAINGYISYISGYQNTKLLKAYNKYCTENNQSGNVVVPVSLLENWDVQAPENTTGWYIPSPKELHMLCCKDVDNIFYAHGNGATPETREYIDPLLSALSGTSLGSGSYWSSMEGSIVEGENMYGAIRLRFNDGAPFGYSKHRDGAAIRAICAF